MTAYILENRVTHIRHLPTRASHTFAYPTVSYLLSLNHLEQHALDLGRGYVFGYSLCQPIVPMITGIRAEAYLNETVAGMQRSSIKQKLTRLLQENFENVGDALENAWMMTMPSICGFEGINPLTTYFCYDVHGRFRVLVLEIHNTFGERYIHVLEPGQGEDQSSPLPKFDHSWTFLRNFHVSPFNDRSGYYKVSIELPSHPPPTSVDSRICPPLPSVKFRMYTSSADQTPGSLKFVATICTKSSSPLTTSNLLSTLSRHPFDLFLTMTRIYHQAWILHYLRRLAVYPRPDPKARDQVLGTTVGWIKEGLLERYARVTVEVFLEQRVHGSDLFVELISANPQIPSTKFTSHSDDVKLPETVLTIKFTSSRFFLEILRAPSPAHALALCEAELPEPIAQVSEREIFLDVFTNGVEPGCTSLSLAQRIRIAGIPRAFLSCSTLPVPLMHPIDRICQTQRRWLLLIFVLIFTSVLDIFERWVYKFLNVRFVGGREPWKKWERVEKSNVREDEINFIGSVVT